MELRPDERLDAVNENITLLQKKNGLTFGTDAFLLSAFCRQNAGGVAADFGCGTGIIALLLAARRRYRHVFAVEVQECFAKITAENIEKNGFSHTVTPLFADVRTLTPAVFGRELDAVVANPPYLKKECGFASPHPEKQIARHEESGGIADFAAAAARCLKSGGLFYTVYRPERLESLFAALRAARLAPKRMVFVHDRENKAPSMVLTEAKLDACEGLRVLPPLFLHDDDPRGLSPRAQAIYDTGSF